MGLRQDETADGEKPPKNIQSDLIQNVIGSFGPYQLGLCLITQTTKYLIAFHQMGIIFLAPKVSYTCGPNMTNTCPCSEPVYDTSIFTNTIVMEWDLICDRRWLVSFHQTIFQLGVLLGSVIFGMAADRFGRKNPLLVGIVLQLLTGVSAAYVTEYWTFTILRCLVGMTVGGIVIICYVIVMEFVGTQHRETVSALYHIPFNIGHMLLAAFGYFLRDFSTFQLAISVPGVLLLSFFFLVPETPRWLIAVRRTDEAVRLLERIAKVNKRANDNIRAEVDAYQAAAQHDQTKKGTILDLFRTPNLRKNIIVMSMNWVVGNYCFYGVSLYVGHLSGNLFVNVAASAGVTLGGTAFALPLMKAFGRRNLVVVLYLVCAGCLLLMTVIPEGAGSVALASIGMVCSLIVNIVLYLYCTELFPTVVRNAALGFTSMCARVGSMIAPFVIDLQTVAPWMPPVAFAIMPLMAGCVTLLLPETKGCELMTTIEEGEKFGKNTDTCYTKK